MQRAIQSALQLRRCSRLFDGDVEEIDEESWSALPLELAEEPEDWTGPLDGIEFDDLKSDTEMTAADWAEPLQPFRPQVETWEEDPEERSDSDTGDAP